MSPKRAPSEPPVLRGFDYVKPLGAGGFADVFLYQQQLPRRRVAVKVLLADRLAQSMIADFTHEANVMAQLSTHPSIVTIYEAGVAGDGRPYLVMEYCPKPNLQIQYRKAPFAVAEALRTGIRIAGAVESAHRAGILHRDIKPANILVNDYNRPLLTDFGIAGAAGADDAAGMSIPWSAPEAFDDAQISAVAGDVFSLAATVYTLLAGRSPFEIPGQRNSSADLIARIREGRLPSLGRADVPISLHTVLAQGMARDVHARFGSALEFAHALQRVEIELSMSPTMVDVLDESVGEDAPESDDDGLTRIRGVVNIDPTGPPPATTGGGERSFSTTDATVLRDSTGDYESAPRGRTAPQPAPDDEPAPDATVVRGTPRAGRAAATDLDGTGGTTQARTHRAEPDEATPETPRRSKAGLIVAGALAVVVVAVIAFASLSGKGTPSVTDTISVDPQSPVIARQVPPIASVTAEVVGDQIVFTWVNPDPQDGDSYLWGIQVAGAAREIEIATEPTVSIPAAGNDGACIEVTLRRVDGRAGAEPTVGCAP